MHVVDANKPRPLRAERTIRRRPGGSLISGAVIIAIVLLGALPAGAADLQRLIERADMVLRGDSSAGVFSMEIQTRSYQRSFEVGVWDESKPKDRTLIKILGPALWRGHGTLKVGNQLKLYNPRTNHVTVVSGSMLGDSWMGSHFTNDDLVKETRLAKDYQAKLLKTWQGKTELGQQVTHYRVQLTPRPTAPVAWGKIVYEVWERDEVVIPTQAHYFRKPGDKDAERALTFSAIKDLGGRTVPTQLRMTLADKPGEHTAIRYKTLKFGIDVPDSKFTEQALRH